ncbi:glycosyl hydrolase family 61-domain-containing protein [Stachybotrys elegans]|uniref:lytic cellulose monooxygenase (C4-dehydrogenating) n=1 Tax=Stachybotrys elegans TaxID=80388 RepID=A0A8K0WL39_9HYPO|nr:glycosyl hydrolase family 61-domain-containing protein [Stachybotrys elegans]
MHTLTTIAAFAAPLIQLAAAHGHVAGVRVNGGSWIQGCDPNWYYQPAGAAPNTPGWKALNQDNGFVSPDAFRTSDIACHKSAKAGETYIDANAGDTLTLYWNTWPDTHKGPIIDYLAPCNGECTSASAGSLSFTKIDQAALISGNNPGTWVTDTLVQNNFTSQFKVPSNLRPGNYVLRHEIIALHAAGSANGAQAYPQCLNLKINSGGSAGLSGGVPGTSLYSATDPGILFNLYGAFTSYPIPGPAVGGPGGDGGSPPPTTTLRPTTTQRPPTSTSSSSVPTGGPGGPGGCTVAKYQQCGGQGYSGCTTCASGSTCQKLNDFYSQCT